MVSRSRARSAAAKRLGWLCRSAGAVLLSVLSVHPAAATLFVANYGVDGVSCGAAATPCRSITQAITNAVPPDIIEVGPGVYGDLNGNTSVDPGDEAWTGSNLINVNKAPLTIRSRDGAGPTLIDATGTGATNVVAITVPGVIFGVLGQGFTVRGGGTGILASVPAHIGGNRVTGNATGIAIQPGSGSFVESNVAMYNTNEGIRDAGTATTVTYNLAVGNGDGAGNGDGFHLAGVGATFEHNVANANEVRGVVVSVPPSTSPVASFYRNAVVGNGHAGVFVDFTGTFTSAVTVALTQNDYFGNGEDASLTHPTTTPNCGVAVNVSDTAALTHSVTSTSDYWGGAPGADPADTVNGICNVFSSGSAPVTVTTPAAGEFVVLPPMVK